MSWLPTLLCGLLTGLFGAVYGGWMASRAVVWLRLSSFEGGSGYFVVAMILVGFALATVIGLVVCRLVGGAGMAGIAKGLGFSLAAVAIVITGLGGIAWVGMDREPMVAGQPISLDLEIRLPPGATAPPPNPDGDTYATLMSGSPPRVRVGQLRFDMAREEDGRWIVPSSVPIHVTKTPRILGVKLDMAEAQYFDAPVPARPQKLDEGWSAWIETPYLGNRTKPAAGTALGLRYRIVVRPPPPPEPEPPEQEPTVQERKEQAFAAIAPDAPTEDWLDLTTLDTPEHVRRAAIAMVSGRPDLGPALVERIGSEDPETARDAMYLVGEMQPPPAIVGDAIKARIGDVLHIARAIDPEAKDSREQLYAQAHVLATGVLAAAHGLRRAGIDIRPELSLMADATRDREKAPPRSIADAAERIVDYFDQLDREKATSRP